MDVGAVAGVLDGIVQECGNDAGYQGSVYVGREALRYDADGYLAGLTGTEAGLGRYGLQQRLQLSALDAEREAIPVLHRHGKQLALLAQGPHH